MDQPMIKAGHLSKSFGGVQAVKDMNLTIEKGEMVGLIGPNGAGKTTLFNLLSGALKPTNGKIYVEGTDMTGKKMVHFARAGVARTFQNIRLLKELTVFENVMSGMHKKANHHILTNIFHTSAFRKHEQQLIEEAEHLLATFNLLGKKDESAVNLSYGDQRRLEIIRALAANPSILFLDEPAAGMNPAEGKELAALIEQVRKDYQMTVVLIEHDMDIVMDLCERILVLDYGELIFNGTPEEVLQSEKVRKAYLGDEVIDA